MSIEKIKFLKPILSPEAQLYTTSDELENALYDVKEFIGSLYPDKVIIIPRGTTNVRSWYGDHTDIKNAVDVQAVLIPDGVTDIGEYAFAGCSSLTNVVIPDSVQNIQNYAFAGCSSLTSIAIGSGVGCIGHSVFSECRGLVSIVFEGTVEEWNAIEKRLGWEGNVPPECVVTCNDDQLVVK